MPSIAAARSTRVRISASANLSRAQAEGDVLEHVQVGVEGVVLEHHGDVAVARAHAVDGLAVDRDRAAVGVLQPGDGAQEGGLAAARGADEDAELAFGDVEVDAAQGVDLAVVFLQAADGQARHAFSP